MDSIHVYDPGAAGTKGLIFIGDELLLYRRDNKTDVFPGAIDVPGGGPEPGETPFETFQREVDEEFGLKVDPSHIIYRRVYPAHNAGGGRAYFVVAVLPAKARDLIHFGDEGDEYLFMSVNEYLKRDDAWPLFQQRTLDYWVSKE